MKKRSTTNYYLSSYKGRRRKYDRRRRVGYYRRRRSPVLPVLAILCAIGIGLLLTGILTSLSLKVTPYELRGDVDTPIRIVQISDLHSRQFGTDNEDLIALVAAQRPDLILMTGDMLNSTDEDLSVVTQLIRALTDTAPVYYSFGNHENSWDKHHDHTLAGVLEKAGAHVLICYYLDTEISGQAVRIGGYYNYFMQPQILTKDSSAVAKEVEWAQRFMDTSRQKLLLSHYPTGWLYWDQIDEYDAGIVFSGHYHGGIIRIPLLDHGLYIPSAGLLPKYTKGLFPGEKSACVLSAGLSGGHGIPRIFNPPEICVVDLLPR